MKGQLVSRQSAAETLGISVRTLDRMLKSGLIPFFQYKAHSKVLINSKDIDAYIHANMHKRMLLH